MGDLGLASLNFWVCLLHLVLPPNCCCFPLPQEMGLDFCLVVAVSSLASRAELLLSLLLYAVREAGLQVTWCRVRGQGLAVTLQVATAQGTCWSCRDPSAEVAKVGDRNHSREELRMALFKLLHGLLSRNPISGSPLGDEWFSRGMFCAEFAPLPCTAPRPPLPSREGSGSHTVPP